MLYDFQTTMIVILSIIVWMAWAIETWGTLIAFFVTLPTSTPASAWLLRRAEWLNRKDERGILDDYDEARRTS